VPYTFAHPAAVLPLRRFCPELGVFAALVIGSMTPDLGYFVGDTELAFRAHSALGLLTECLPLGIVSYILAFILYVPATRLLPSPHRQALQAIRPFSLPTSIRSFLVLALALILGAATHNVWDAFTHRTSVLARQWSVLRWPVFSIERSTFVVADVLQHISSVFGLAVLAVMYARWLKRTGNASPPSDHDGWRYGLLAFLCLASLVLALPLSLWNTGGDPVHPSFMYLMIRYAVAATALFCGGFILVAILLWPLKRS
jgi:hypothetical protein